VRCSVEFLSTDHLQEHPPFKRQRGGYTIHGVGLPAEVLDRILWRNAERIISRG
jgi:hypothetical protein